MDLRLLSGDDITNLLPVPRAIGLMREAFVRLSSGEAVVPPRLRVDAPKSGCRTLVMPGHVGQAIGLKAVSIQPANTQRALPTIHGLMIVLDATTGIPLALMEAERLTAIRTGAASGLATDLLARRDASAAAVFGTGPQARTQLEAVASVRRLHRVLVFSRTRGKALAFADAMSARLQTEVIPTTSPQDLLKADIICTATTSTRPVFEASHVRPGTHINAIGSFSPDVIEVPSELVARSIIVVDERAACLREAGEIVQTVQAGLMREADIRAEIGELADGTATGRTSEDEITLFKSVGNAVQDVMAAEFIVRAAEEQGAGRLVRL